jgi:hypothetical protein
MTTHPFTDPDAVAAVEDLAEGGTWLLDLVSAVDHLRKGLRPGLTVWDAITDAIRDGGDPSTTGDRPPTGLVDDLRTAGFPTTAGEAQAAVRRWVTTMAARYNNGHHWPHPLPRRGFPTPMLAVDRDAEEPPAS